MTQCLHRKTAAVPAYTDPGSDLQSEQHLASAQLLQECLVQQVRHDPAARTDEKVQIIFGEVIFTQGVVFKGTGGQVSVGFCGTNDLKL